MGYVFDGSTKRITLTSGTTLVNVNDLYSRWKDWVRTNSGFLKAFNIIGGEPIGGGLTAGVYLFLTNGWSIVPWAVNHTLTIQGNLVRDPEDSSGTPLFQGVAANVLIQQQTSAVALGYSTGGGTGGGSSSFSVADIWNYGSRSLTIAPLTASQVWTHTSRTLTEVVCGNGSGSDNSQLVFSATNLVSDDDSVSLNLVDDSSLNSDNSTGSMDSGSGDVEMNP